MATARALRHDRDMTEGGIFGNLFRFSLPLLAGNLFQQLYNMVDTWVIGQTGENGAYAAVGSVAPVINIIIGFFLGFSSGAGVLISQYYGAGQKENVRETVHTAVTLTLVLGVVLSVVGVLITPWTLEMMLHTNGEADEVFPHAQAYLTIYFSGMLGMMLYNVGAGILRAVGDSRRPFYFLVVSAVTNTLLDFVFVFGLDLGAAGVAWATVIAQWVSAVLTFLVLLRTDSCIRLIPKMLRIHGDELKKILKLGFPAALQMALTAFSNVFVQGYIAGVNGNKTTALSSWTSYSKIDQFVFLPVQSIALAVTTFVGQNLGKGNIRRARRGVTVGFAMSFVSALCIIVPVMLFAPFFASLFNADTAVVESATMLLRVITPFYLCTCVNQIFAGGLRGAGNTRAPMLIMLTTFVGFRQLYLYVVSSFISNDLIPIALGYPAGWILCATVTLIYYRFYRFEKGRMVDPETEKK